MGIRIFKGYRGILIIAALIVATLTAGVFIYWKVRPGQNKQPLVSEYIDMKMTDIHNHDAERRKYKNSKRIWDEYAISRVVLFGNLPSPEAVTSDKNAWTAYKKYPDIVVPFISGFNIHDETCLTYIRNQLEKGCFGLGELVGASTASPVASTAAWKAEHPMDGFFSKIYDLAAEYHAPVLLHLDPPTGNHMIKFEEALDNHPDTIFIYAHANAYNTIENIDRLMRAHKNLYIDFFAGFTAFNPDSQLTLKDYAELIRKYPDRFFLSTDSGYDLDGGLTRAYEACYLLLDELGDETLAKKIAFENFDAILQAMPVTKTQMEALKSLDSKVTDHYDLSSINKFEAGRIILDVTGGRGY